MEEAKADGGGKAKALYIPVTKLQIYLSNTKARGIEFRPLSVIWIG